jgi:predicted nucleic acid-binding protein
VSRIFWDTMLFIYLLEGNDAKTNRVIHLLKTSRDRGDSLFTSHLVLGEVLAGAAKSPFPEKSKAILEVAAEMGIVGLPFDAGAVETFGYLRAVRKLKIADSINLACAASTGMDLFLTNDNQLAGLHIQGIQFVAHFETPIL